VRTNICFVGSKKLADTLMEIVAKVSGNGGKACFAVEEDKVSSRPGNRCWSIQFLPAQFRKLHPEFTRLPNTHAMAGFLHGYQYAMKRGK